MQIGPQPLPRFKREIALQERAVLQGWTISLEETLLEVEAALMQVSSPQYEHLLIKRCQVLEQRAQVVERIEEIETTLEVWID